MTPKAEQATTTTNLDPCSDSIPDKLICCDNYINGEFVPPESGSYMPVYSPSTGAQIGQVALSSANDVNDAVKAAEAVFHHWYVTYRGSVFCYYYLVSTLLRIINSLLFVESTGPAT